VSPPSQNEDEVRVFHFLKANDALDDLKRRRLKISLISDLNDPFEFLSLDLSNKHLRRGLHAAKQAFAEKHGLLCFSRKWSNPVLWSHYADRHRGICLGFDVPDECLAIVSYTAKRLARQAESLLTSQTIDENTVRMFLAVKYAHWKYEGEVRCFTELKDKDPITGFYLADFSDSLRLAQIIVGAQSHVSRAELAEALGSSAEGIRPFKARLAFKSFSIVRNKNHSLWL
jgi:hypothetical protein